MLGCGSDEVLRALLIHVICRFGPPKVLLSDRGTNFLSALTARLCAAMKIHQVAAAAYHPQSNAIVERFNRVLGGMLRAYADASQKNWDLTLPFVLHAYRTAINASTGYSPYFLMCGRLPHDLPDYRLLPEGILGQGDDETVGQWLAKLQMCREEVRAFNERQKQERERLSVEVRGETTSSSKFQVGDVVFLKLEHVPAGKSKKLTDRWLGGCLVVGVFEDRPNNVLLEVPNGEHIMANVERVSKAPDLPNRREVSVVEDFYVFDDHTMHVGDTTALWDAYPDEVVLNEMQVVREEARLELEEREETIAQGDLKTPKQMVVLKKREEKKALRLKKREEEASRKLARVESKLHRVAEKEKARAEKQQRVLAAAEEAAHKGMPLLSVESQAKLLQRQEKLTKEVTRVQATRGKCASCGELFRWCMCVKTRVHSMLAEVAMMVGLQSVGTSDRVDGSGSLGGHVKNRLEKP